MSGIAKGVGKVFKKGAKAVGSVVKGATKAVSGFVSSPVGRIALLAGAAYLTYGMATGGFAAPAVGSGTMPTTLATVASSGPAAPAMGAGMGATSGGFAAANVPGMAASSAAPLAGATSGGFAAANVPGMVAPGVVNSAVPAVTQTAAVEAAKSPGIFGWMKDNPMATMMLGQAGAGAYQGYLLDKQQEREDDKMKKQGLMGFDYHGRGPSTGPTGGGVIASQMSGPEDAVSDPSSATVAPGVRAPADTMPRRLFPVSREKLPELSRFGQIVSG